MIVVLFSGTDLPDVDVEEQGRTSTRMQEIVASIPGFISYNYYESESGDGVIVARFESLDALEAWCTHPEHLQAQERDRASFSKTYWVQVSSTVREYRWTRGLGYQSDLQEMFTAGSGDPAHRRTR